MNRHANEERLRIDWSQADESELRRNEEFLKFWNSLLDKSHVDNGHQIFNEFTIVSVDPKDGSGTMDVSVFAVPKAPATVIWRPNLTRLFEHFNGLDAKMGIHTTKFSIVFNVKITKEVSRGNGRAPPSVEKFNRMHSRDEEKRHKHKGKRDASPVKKGIFESIIGLSPFQ